MSRQLQQSPMAQSSQIIDFEVWKTIQLGTRLETLQDYRRELKTKKCDIGYDDKTFENLFSLISERFEEIDLVKIPATECRTHGEIYELAKQAGLEKCPAEVGIQLCLQTTEPMSILSGSLHIGMEPIMSPVKILGQNIGKYPRIFTLFRYCGGDRRLLSVVDSLPDSPWDGIYQFGSEKSTKPGEWIFIKPRK